MQSEAEKNRVTITASLTPTQAAACVVLLTRMKNLGYHQLATSDAEAEQMQAIQAALAKIRPLNAPSRDYANNADEIQAIKTACAVALVVTRSYTTDARLTAYLA